MLALLKRDLYVYGWSLLLLLIVLPVGLGLPQEFMFFLLIAGFIIHLYYYDNKDLVNYFLVSLPIKKGTVVKSRYLSILCTAIMVMISQWIFHLLAHAAYLNEWFYPVYIFRWQDFVALLSLFLIISSILLPLFYMFRSFTTIIIIQVVVMVVGMVAFLASILGEAQSFYINNQSVFVAEWMESNLSQPYLILPIIGILLYYLSMHASKQLMKRKVV